MFAQGFQLRAEDQRATWCDCVIERLLAHAIARNEELACAGIPDSESKHAAQMFDTTRAVLFVSTHNRFGVRMSFELTAARLEFALQFAIVVNLAVEDNCDRTVAAGHRLMSACKIDDRQT